MIGLALGFVGQARAQLQEQLVFAVKPSLNEDHELWRANADGTFQRHIDRIDAPCGTKCGSLAPSLSPVGNQIAFKIYVDLYTANVDGSATQQITHAQYGENHNNCSGSCLNVPLERYMEPEWSPDATKIAFWREDLTDNNPEWNGIYVMNADGSNMTKIVSWAHINANPTWSPDGQRIAFASYTTPDGTGTNGATLWSVAADGSDPQQHTTRPVGVGGPEALSPAWSPDGSSIAFASGDVWRVDVNSGAVERLTATAGGEYAPDWSPDGSTIAFSAPDGIGAINADGTNYRLVIPNGSWFEAAHPSYRAGVGSSPPPPSATQLLLDYAPQLRYDQQETFRADSAATITDNVVLDSRGRLIRRNTLRDGTNQILASPYEKDRKYSDLSLSFLGWPWYSDGLAAASGDYLDEEGSDTEKALDAQRLHGLSQYANKIYGRVTPGFDGSMVLQYWFWYYFNSKGVLGIGPHEGDWEMISVVLDDSYQPLMAGYAQHTGGETCAWTNVQRTLAERPIVYVAQDSHASYFSAGDHFWQAGAVIDNADGQGGPPIVPAVESIDSDPSWTQWPGRWGSSGSSPAGPAHGNNAPKYDDPLGWVNTNDNCTEGQTQMATAAAAAPRRARRSATPRPPAPHIRAKKRGQRVVIRYRFKRWPRGRHRRPVKLITSVDPAGRQYPPLTVHTDIRQRRGRISQPLGAGEGPFRVLASAQARSGAVSRTTRVRMR